MSECAECQDRQARSERDANRIVELLEEKMTMRAEAERLEGMIVQYAETGRPGPLCREAEAIVQRRKGR